MIWVAVAVLYIVVAWAVLCLVDAFVYIDKLEADLDELREEVSGEGRITMNDATTTDPRAYVDESGAADITRALARFLAREIEIPLDLHNDVTTIITAAKLYGSHLDRVANREGSR